MIDSIEERGSVEEFYRNRGITPRGASIEPLGLRADRSLRERVAGLLDKLVFFSLLALIFLTALPYGTVEVWWEAAFEGTVLILTALWIIEGLLSGAWYMKGDRLLLPLLALIFLALYQIIPLPSTSPGAMRETVSADPYATLLWAFKFLALMLAGMLLMRYTSNRYRLQALIYSVIGIAAVSALFGISRQIMQAEPMGFILPDLERSVGYGQFISRNYFAFLMEMALGLSLGLVVSGGVRREHLPIYIVTGLPIWAALVLSNSRGGILSMLIQVFLLGLLFINKRHARASSQRSNSNWLWRACGSPAARIILLVCLMMAAVIGIVWVGGDPLLARLEDTKSEVSLKDTSETEGSYRTEIWRATWQLIKAHPVIGTGFGGYQAAITKHLNGSGEWGPKQAHNDYLELLASGGIVGVALSVWALSLFFRGVREKLRHSDNFYSAASIGALIGIIGVAVHSFVDFGLHSVSNALVFTVLVVIAVVNTRVQNTSRSNEEPQHSL